MHCQVATKGEEEESQKRLVNSQVKILEPLHLLDKSRDAFCIKWPRVYSINHPSTPSGSWLWSTAFYFGSANYLSHHRYSQLMQKIITRGSLVKLIQRKCRKNISGGSLGGTYQRQLRVWRVAGPIVILKLLRRLPVKMIKSCNLLRRVRFWPTVAPVKQILTVERKW